MSAVTNELSNTTTRRGRAANFMTRARCVQRVVSSATDTRRCNLFQRNPFLTRHHNHSPPFSLEHPTLHPMPEIAKEIAMEAGKEAASQGAQAAAQNLGVDPKSMAYNAAGQCCSIS
jgi:hypothetical protein